LIPEARIFHSEIRIPQSEIYAEGRENGRMS